MCEKSQKSSAVIPIELKRLSLTESSVMATATILSPADSLPSNLTSASQHAAASSGLLMTHAKDVSNACENSNSSFQHLNLAPISLTHDSLQFGTNNFGAHRNLENFAIIWLEKNIKETDDYLKLKQQLRQTINCLKTFDNTDLCVDYITDVNDEIMFFLIVSDTIGKLLVPLIYELPQIVSIYIFYSNECEHEAWFKKYPKVSGVFGNTEAICTKLISDTQRYSNNLLSMTFLSSSCSPFENSSDLNKQEASFMYAQLLQDILISMEERADMGRKARGKVLPGDKEQIVILKIGNYIDESKRDMIDLCRSHYADNDSELRKIAEFDETYSRSDAIRWYTRDCFLYRILNKALRLQDVEVLYSIRFFIAELHAQLQELHSKSSLTMPITVYRGQAMTCDEFEKLKKNINGLLSMNNFISTTTDKETALSFTFPYINCPDTEAVLFEINIDSMAHGTPYANVTHLSYMPLENEVLFSLNAVFRIKSAIKSDDGVWHVVLNLSGNEDEQLKALTSYMRKRINRSGDLSDLIKLMIEMGEYTKVEKFYQLKKNDIIHETLKEIYPLIKADYYNDFGRIYQNQGNVTKALQFYKKSLEILRDLKSSSALYAVVYNNIGLLYCEEADYTQAFENLEKAIEVSKGVPNIDPEFLTNFHNNIGLVHEKLGNYSEALSIYLQALDTKLKFLPSSHPSLAATYNNIGMLFEKQSKPQEALAYYRKANNIQKNSLPPFHIDRATILHNIGSMLLIQGEYKEALANFTAELEILLRMYPNSHIHVKETQSIIDAIYFKLSMIPQ